MAQQQHGNGGIVVPLRGRSPRRRWQRWLAVAGIALMAAGWVVTGVGAQTGGGTLTLRSDVQEANAQTGVITARGNVQIDFPAQQIFATAAQAQYFDRDRRIILSGNVVVNQQGNRLEAETVTYLIDEGRFIALPQSSRQVRATYQIRDLTPAAPRDVGSSTAPLNQTPPVSQRPDATLELTPLPTSLP